MISMIRSQYHSDTPTVLFKIAENPRHIKDIERALSALEGISKYIFMKHYRLDKFDVERHKEYWRKNNLEESWTKAVERVGKRKNRN